MPDTTTPLADRLMAKALETPWLMRLPIPMYRAGLGWMLGSRFVMIEHLGRTSGERRFAVVEVMGRGPNFIRVASGLGTKSQWYRNLRANGVAYLSTGHARRARASVRILPTDEAAQALEHYAAEYPDAWRHLKSAMDYAAGGDAVIPVIEFGPPA
ncbi:hypothetical protein GCM10022200_13960 [Microbacterium awajiense]|uniref:Nitroreductase n=1 Tax=Microbacterium awajiense TaxID=415214 RepID=A0ABP7AHW1_9MICO